MPSRQPPIINAPWPVAVFALVLVGAHLVRILLPGAIENAVFFYGALIPERFWAPAGGMSAAGLPAYANGWEAFVPMVASAFIHGDWMHVIFNAAFLVALAKPLHEVFRRIWPGPALMASAVLLGLFLVSQVASSLVYLAASYPDGAPAVGASGGISGLLAAVLLLREGPDRWLFTRNFAVASALFVVGNALFAFVGPALLGAGVAWQAHVGGYFGGALCMRAILWRVQARRA
ncbi:MAG: rhomboid family intramembrane serine protease [Hyphomonas sp.]|uniref:rhomboid family intramembrane serine protease n=1 Tax=Hyphomonas sp. TaxID=87 RepID=UPI0017E15152|nr:rhomboid family intramembrane serine protease [Hyphomonas sp.]MBA3069099.1 rhomboid family intramembrane serine protease [Hyphomonas sp.]MBU4063572.1 rhomboid family intramembrane serine protease [Alphaproteobacteria bacterium]MBU4165041.1 rhomboid family intramembrane serine protease [Alphaproteobacteria bacterium]MBU4569515.1 rhomboid family intramembrane serine protease [Alphaproteobacteria bacterium]